VSDDPHEFRFVDMDTWPFSAHTCRERLLAENQSLREELKDRERPARYAPDYTPIEGTYVFLQWKGTDVCLDFHCVCGADGHFDGYFAYALRCAECGRVWSLPHSVALVEGSDNDVVKDVPKEYGDWRFPSNALCYVCNKPAVFGSTDLVERTLPGSTATTVVHEDCVFVELKP
jgi:hypothetical protein